MFRFPFGTVQELNLDWFLEQWEIFKTEAQEAFEGIDHALDDEIARVEAAMSDLYAARDAAIAAKNAAETAESSTLGYAQSAANSAASAAGSAAGSATSASSSAGSAEQAAQSAQTSAQQASSAATSAGNASSSATAAAGSATAAAGSASNAADSATAAAGSATAAAGSATAAAGSATAAAGSASDAADSAASVSASAAQIAQNADDIADLQTDLDAAESAITNLQTDMTAAESDISGLQTDMTDALSDISTLQTNLDAAESDIAGLQTDLDAAESDIADLQTNLDAAESNIADLQTNLPIIEANALAAFPEATIENQSIASFSDGADNIPIKDLAVHIEPVQAGSGDPSTVNVRNISGHTECVVTRTGKNLLPNNASSGTINGVTFTVNPDKSVSISGTATDNADFSICNANAVKLPENASLILSGGVSSDVFLRCAIDNRTPTSRGEDVSINTTNGIVTGNCYIRVLSGTTVNGVVVYPMIRIANDNADYEPYQSETYSITFPTEAGTVYSGSITVNQDGSGTLMVDRAFATFDGTENWRWSTTSDRPHIGLPASKFNGVLQTNMYPYSPSATQVNGTCTMNGGEGYDIWISDSVNAPDLTAWKAFLSENNLEVVYELATPVTYTLTAEQAGVITTLYGNNRVWSNCGNIDMTYRTWNNPDVKLRLTKALLAPVLDSMTADTALSENDFRIVGDTLYKITASVASGGTLTPGTNCIATTVCAEITSILNA